MKEYDVIFPHLFGGIKIEHLDPVAFRLFGLEVYWYGIIITAGIVAGYYLAAYRAKKMSFDPEIINDFVLYAVIAAVIGARVYYVIFSWQDYKDNLLYIFNLRRGGLAIYGAVIGAVAAALAYSKWKKTSFFKIADVAAPGLILGQIIGRWGNFMNMEAFGGASDGLLAMALRWDKVKYIPAGMENQFTLIDGVKYLQVQPTFLYESLWNLGVLLFLLFWTKKRRFDGEIFCLYLLGYGLGRVWIEGLRTDQLLLSAGVPVSQVLAGILIIGSAAWWVIGRKKQPVSDK